ncbi:hypothetical protein Acid345_4751 [Candidatus Koribacter versatilis Ellin345]|uniref:STAS domain-containing protein n=2 Tax=Candidatus Korobacter versatilis TaxID=658062 RepID=Q1IHA0_KORVE|nr:hypothetical protein Acid345_4751 [Candidatus Koribacter versatilis Ellin345]
METAFAFDSRTEVLKVTLVGRVDSAPLLVLMGTLRRLGEQLRPRAVVYDCSAIESVDFDSSFVTSLAGLRPVFESDVLGVILAPHEYIFGIARMYQGMTAGKRPNVHVVKSWPEVLNALGLSAPPRYADVPVA